MRGPRWLEERVRAGVSLGLAVVVTALAVLILDADHLSVGDALVLGLFSYLLCYLVTTIAAFSRATASRIRGWAEREDRGTFLQRYVYGTAPGPGASIFIAAGALAVEVLWLPAHHGARLPTGLRVVVAVALVSVAWACVVVAFAVAFHADNLVEDEKALEFPGSRAATWSDYAYFAVAVMSTFGTTDVSVVSGNMRRTVTVNAIIAFVFNTVVVATMVSALSAL